MILAFFLVGIAALIDFCYDIEQNQKNCAQIEAKRQADKENHINRPFNSDAVELKE